MWNNIISSFSSDELVASSLRQHGIVLVAITASGHGVRIIGERLSLSGAPSVSAEKTTSIGSDSIRQLESIEAAQLRIATALNIPEYDSVTKDLARASYVVPRDYILFIDESGLFSSSIAAGLYPAFFFYSLGCHPSHFHTFTLSHFHTSVWVLILASVYIP